MTRSRGSWPPASARYLVALVLPLLALILTEAMSPLIKLNNFNLFQAAVFLSAWYGGLGPGIVTSLLSTAVIDYMLIPPMYEFSFAWADDAINLAVFWATTLIMSSLSAGLRRTKIDLERAHDDLEVRIKERTEELSQANARLNREVVERLEAEEALLKISGREQKRMGQDLHDGLCQTLSGLRLLANVLAEKLEAKSIPEVAVVTKMEARLSEAIAQAEDVSHGLYPVELETNGLMAALREMAQSMSSMHGVTCRSVFRKPIFVQDSAVATHLFRIAQEGVVNAIKNGKARIITLRLIGWRRSGILVIKDNGVGFDSTGKYEGMGLKIMNYRARMIGAALDIRSHKGRGTLVGCAFPSAYLEQGAARVART